MTKIDISKKASRRTEREEKKEKGEGGGEGWKEGKRRTRRTKRFSGRMNVEGSRGYRFAGLYGLNCAKKRKEET